MARRGTDRSKRYENVEFLGEGQFATVYKAKDLHNGNKVVAVKKIKLGQRSEAEDGINRTALREIKLLQELQHENIIGLLDVFGQRSNISLVFDFMDTDLEVIIKDESIVLTPAHIKAYMIMTLRGLEYLHMNWILHRDMKPNNLLINDEGVLKIGDFGLAKFYGSPSKVYTHQVVTRWYRCPELLFGARKYGTGVDMWATGCILAELLLRLPFLAGDSDLNQLSIIFETLGTPTEEQWPCMKSLPDFVEFKKFPGTPLSDIFTAATDDLLELLSSMLDYNPCKRCTATQDVIYAIKTQIMKDARIFNKPEIVLDYLLKNHYPKALKMRYFFSKPGPSPGLALPRPGAPSEVLKEEGNGRAGRKRKLPDESSVHLAKKLVF